MKSSQPFILLGLSIAGFALCYFFMKRIQYNDADTEDKCNTALANDVLNYKEGGSCHAWDGSQCRKGTFKNNDCAYEGSYFPLLFLLLGLVFLGWSVYSFYINF